MVEENPFAPPESQVEGDYFELSEYEKKEWKKLKKLSSNIGALGLLWAVFGVIFIFVGFFLFSERNAPLFAAGSMVFGVVLGISCYGSLVRPYWGRPVGMLVGVIFIVIGVLGVLGGGRTFFHLLIGGVGLVSFLRGKSLFGPDRVTHGELKARLRAQA